MTLTPTSLRVETADGFAAEEYRISDGQIQFRETRAGERIHREWRTLTPAELTSHVMQKSIVSRWLLERLGWRALLRACAGDQQGLFGEAATDDDRRAA